MNVLEIISGVLLLIVCLVIIVVVMLQENKQNGAQALGGMSDSYLGRNSGRTIEAMLAKITKYAAVGFFVLTILVSVFSVYLGK